MLASPLSNVCYISPVSNSSRTSRAQLLRTCPWPALTVFSLAFPASTSLPLLSVPSVAAWLVLMKRCLQRITSPSILCAPRLASTLCQAFKASWVLSPPDRLSSDSHSTWFSWTVFMGVCALLSPYRCFLPHSFPLLPAPLIREVSFL